MANLVVIDGPDKGRFWSLFRFPATIGRKAGNTIVLNDITVSGTHSRFVKNGEAIAIQDCQSTNGTWVNGKVVPTHDLQDGDRIEIGNSVILFEIAERSELKITPAGGVAVGGAVSVVKTESVTRLGSATGDDELLAIAKDIPGARPEDVRRTFDTLAILYRMDRLLSETEDLDDLLQRLTDLALDTVRARRGFVILVDERSGEMVPQIVRDRGGSASAGATDLGDVPVSRTVLREVVERRDSVITRDALVDERFRGSSSIENLRVRSVMAVPLLSRDKVVGVLYCDQPVARAEFGAGDLRILAAVGRKAGLSVENARLARDFDMLFSSAMEALIDSIQAKDVYTRGHSERVRFYSRILARELALPPLELERVQLGAVLHDVGKIGMPDRLLFNTTPLTPEQLAEVKRHPVEGAKILQNIPFLREVVPAARNHHEDWNGKGYPDGLAGDAIPLIARIVAVADTYDAVTTDRPYQKGRSKEEGLELLQRLAGKRLEPRLVDAFAVAYRKSKRQDPAAPVPAAPGGDGATGAAPVDTITQSIITIG